MANELIGDFDLAAELSLPAVNRFFAAMHQAERTLTDALKTSCPPSSAAQLKFTIQ